MMIFNFNLVERLIYKFNDFIKSLISLNDETREFVSTKTAKFSFKSKHRYCLHKFTYFNKISIRAVTKYYI